MVISQRFKQECPQYYSVTVEWVWTSMFKTLIKTLLYIKQFGLLRVLSYIRSDIHMRSQITFSDSDWINSKCREQDSKERIVAIIGSGNLGRHHLAGILLSNKSIHIHMVDPSVNALSEAEKRFDIFKKKKSNKSISLYRVINELPKKLFIAIIATTAEIRREIKDSTKDIKDNIDKEING